MTDQAWHALEVSAVATALATSATAGLSSDEIPARIDTYGHNQLRDVPSKSWLPLLWSQFTDPLTLILVIAVAISALIGETLDAVAILLILLINGVLGFVQEWRADQAIEALQAMLVPRARVRRDGIVADIPAIQIVPGDLVVFEAGDRVPADLRVVDAVMLLADESALTGESAATSKAPVALPVDTPLADRASLVFSGTDIAAGRGSGIAFATGDATEFGAIAELTAGAEPGQIPLQRSLASLGRSLGFVAVLIAAVTVLVGIAAGREANEMFLTGVSLAVAIVPEGLPAVVTVTLALGIRSMSRRNALLRQLEAAETLGAASVICTDKTGTLTQNRMTVRSLWTTDGSVDLNEGVDGIDSYQPTPIATALIQTAQRCNNATISVPTDGSMAGGQAGDDNAVVGDPTETALLRLARRLEADGLPVLPLLAEIPFDSDRKMMTVVLARDDVAETHVKGAPEVVLDRCTKLARTSGSPGVSYGEGELGDVERSSILAVQSEMAARGLRTLAFACRADSDVDPDEVDDTGLTFLGLVGMHDPPRPEVPAAVATARSAGLDVVVMTGDAGGTARAIAEEIGLPIEGILTGGDLERLDDDALLPFLDGSQVLARVTPAHKMRVVDLLQRNGAVVAMTGDGVNDAPALKQASIGIAMGRRGTDVARSAADIVLTDDNFASIVAAIEEGRRQYANIRKFIRYLLSSNLGEVVAISGSVALGWPLILLPAQILWMNLLTDGITALALGLEPAEPDGMDRPPRQVDESIIGRSGGWWILGFGGLIGLTSLAVFWWQLGTGEGEDLVRAQSMAFTAMVLLETVNVFNFRAERQPLRAIGFSANRWLLVACGLVVVTQIGAVELPGISDALGTTNLSVVDWAVLAGIAMPLLAVGEIVKAVIRRQARVGCDRTDETERMRSSG